MPLQQTIGHSGSVQEVVQRPFEAQQPQGRAQLMELLSRTMTRASKGTLLTLPKLTRTVCPSLGYPHPAAAASSSSLDII